MAQVTPPMAPTNASLPGLVTPGRPEQTKNIGVRTPSTDDVSQPMKILRLRLRSNAVMLTLIAFKDK